MKTHSQARTHSLTVLVCALSAVPLVACAQTTLSSIADSFVTNIVNVTAQMFLGLATVAFLYGVLQYIGGLREGNGEKTKKGSNTMIWGLAALFVMASIWGIVYYVQDIFGIQGQNNIVIPAVRIG